MKLVVCTNFAQPFHTGGAERVVQQITESLVRDHGFECIVFCQHGSLPRLHNGVNVVPVGSDSESVFIERLLAENADHIFVYSDWFFRWPTILANTDRIKANKSIALVGMNRMRSSVPANAQVAELFKKTHQNYSVIAHAENYIDVATCKKWGIPVTIIHNAVDLNEFKPSSFDFKAHYGIRSEKMLLCVSNFFPGKGQEFLPPIISRLYAKRKDFSFVFISSTLAFEPGNRLRAMVKSVCESKSLPVRFINDIPREHVVQSNFASDAFVFPSQQECGPIVVLEAMAAQKPWIAMDVGHIDQLRGGFQINSSCKRGELKDFDGIVSSKFYEGMDKLLSDKELSALLGKDGRANIEEAYNWSKVSEEYSKFFRNKR